MKGAQLVLPGADVISSVSYNQDEILQSIVRLHVPAGVFDCDASYGYGGFYNRLPRPKHCFDIAPKRPEAVQADSRALPLPAGSLASLMFDPPFVIAHHVESETYLMDAKYGGYRTLGELREHYSSSITEFARVLRPGGVLVFKCQDQVHGRTNYFLHCEVAALAITAGFRPVDLFILVARNRFVGSYDKQNHARKFHSYFWVFRRRPGKTTF